MEKVVKNLRILGLITIILLIPVLIWMQIQAGEKAKNHFKEFNSAVIDSQIMSIRIAYKVTGMKLVDGREFVFYPFTDKNLNDGNKFNYTAEKGDYVFKSKYSDSLLLIKRGKRFVYTFKKYD